MVRIRTGRLTDAIAAARLDRAVAAVPGMLVAYPSEVSAAYQRSLINQAQAQNGAYLVAEDGGKLIGTASLRPMDLRAIAHVYRLSITVALSHVSQGIGTRMMKDLLARAKRIRNLRKVELMVRASNARARRLYENFGFRVEGRLKQRVCLPDGSFVDDLSMAWFPRKLPANRSANSDARVGAVIGTNRRARAGHRER